MLYIGFSDYSNKTLARMLCKKYKHCAPIIIDNKNIVIYQFVHMNKIVKIIRPKCDLNRLCQNGWVLIKYHTQPKQNIKKKCLTCVQFTKYVCGIKNIWIQTPLDLFKYIK